jgi:hypothetical protein
MSSSISRNIKHRETPNDVFITPIELAKQHINMINYKENEIWLDPFKNSGVYFNNFPSSNNLWCEILEQKDFFEFDKQVDIICSNPPYSLMDKVLEKSISLKPRIISYLIGIGNLTSRRIEMMEKTDMV